MIQINKKLLAILLVVAVLLGASSIVMLAGVDFGGLTIIKTSEKKEYEYYVDKYSKLEKVMNYFKTQYYEDVDDETLLEGAYAGVASAMGDPYTQYVEAEDSDQFYNDITGKYYGIGMVFFENEDGNLEVDSCYIDSPSYNAGIKPGDLILRSGETELTGMDTTKVRDMIRGEKNTVVTLTLSREGNEYTVEMKRAEIYPKTVSTDMLRDDIGYIYVSAFEEKTAEEFKTALEEIEGKGAKKFVLDLRYNGGGLVDVANEIADMIMDKGTLIVAQNAHGIKEYLVTSQGRTDMEYIVLVNGYTASASEIIAAGVQDNNEAVLVGEKTYGKGVIQQTEPLSDGSAIKLTILEYFSPSGKTINKVGIEPDYVVELPYDATDDYQLNKALELLGAENVGPTAKEVK